MDLLWPQPEFDRVASRVLSSQLLSKANQIIENLKAKVGGLHVGGCSGSKWVRVLGSCPAMSQRVFYLH